MGSAASITAESLGNRLANLTDAQITGIEEILSKGPSKNRSSVLSLLADLSVYEANQAAIISTNYMYMQSLLAVLSGTAEEKKLSLQIFANVSALKENKAVMLLPEVGLVDKLVGTLRKGSPAEHELVLATLSHLSTERVNVGILLKREYDIVGILTTEFRPSGEEVYMLAISLLFQLIQKDPVALLTPDICATIVPYVVAGLALRGGGYKQLCPVLINMFSTIAQSSSPATTVVCSGLPSLVALLDASLEDAEMLALLKVIEHIVIKVGDSECHFKARQTDLIRKLQGLLKTKHQDIYLRGLNILYQLSEWQEHVLYMCAADLQLVSFLVHELRTNPWREHGDECSIACLMALINISTPESNKAPMAAPMLGVVVAAKEAVVKNKGLVRLLALKILMDLAMSPKNIDYMATAEIDLFLVLMEIIFQFEEDEIESISCCLEIIQQLLTSVQNKKYISSLQLGIMKLMMAVIDRDVGDPTRIALLIIYNISLDRDGVVFVAAALRLGLHERLGVVISKNSPMSPQATIAWGCLTVISKTTEHIEFLVEQLSFLQLLVGNIAPHTDDSVRLIVVDIFMNLIKDSYAIPKIVLPTNGVKCLQSVVAELELKREGYMPLLVLVQHMSRSRAVLEFLASPELGLLHSLTSDLGSTVHVMVDGPARVVILEIIVNLSVSHSNVEHMLSSEANLYKALLAVVRDDKSVEEVVLALKSIQNFSLLTKNAILMASAQFGLLKRLLTIIRDQRDQRSNAALSVLSNLSAVPETVDAMGSEEAGQIIMFSDILRSVEDVSVVVDVLKVLKSLSAHSTSNKLYMASPSHELVSIILKILKKTENQEVKENVLKILRNLSGASKNQAALAAPEMGLLSPLFTIARGSPSDARMVALAVLRNLTYDKSVAEMLIKPEMQFLDLLSLVLDENQTTDSAVNCLSALQNLFSFPNNIDLTTGPGAAVVAVLLKVVRCNRVECKSLGFRVLRNLSASNARANHLVSADCSLIQALFEIIQEGRDVDVTQCLHIFVVLTQQESNIVYFASKELGLLQRLAGIVKEDHTEARSLALACLSNLSCAKENLANFCDESICLLPILSGALKESYGKLVRSSESKVRVEAREALRVIFNMCADDTVKISVVSSLDLGFLKTMIDLLKISGADDVKALTLRILHRLTSVGSIKVSFGSPEAGLVALLRDMLLVSLSTTPSGDTPEVVSQILNVLLNISTVRKSMLYMGSDSIGLIPVLVTSINRPQYNAEDKKRVLSLSILQNITCADEAIEYCSADDVGLTKLLFKLIVDFKTGQEELALALGVLRNMSTNSTNMIRFCDPKLKLFPTLASVLREGNAKEKLNALVILQNVSCVEQNIIALGRPESQLVPLLMIELRNGDLSLRDLANTAIDVIRNLSSVSINIEYLISAPLLVLDSMVEIIQRDGDADTSINALGALCNFADECVVAESLLEKRVHSLAIDILSKDRDCGNTESWGDDETLPICALIYLMNLAQWDQSFKIFEEEGVITLLQDYIAYLPKLGGLPFPKAHMLRAFMTMLFLVRHKEEHFYWDTLCSGPIKLADIMTFIEAILKGNPPAECELIHLKMLLRASTCLCANAHNLKAFGTPRTAELFLSVLKAHRAVPGSPRPGELRVGLDCAELAVQGLVSISFVYTEDRDLLNQLMLPHLQDDLVPLLNELNEKVSKLEFKQLIMYLLYRLRGRDGMGYLKPFSSQKHIVISYALDKASKDGIIVSLQTGLIKLGYEVWTDTTGSLVTPEVSNRSLGNQIARVMAAKTSAALIVCVSRLFKQTLFNRMDVTLASSVSGCQFIFALMESDYGVDSAPDRIDGWLGSLMREHLTAPVVRLWLSSHVKTSADSIAQCLGDQVARSDVILNATGAGAHRANGNTSIIPMEASLLGLSAEQVTKFNTAWEILQTSTNAIDYDMLCKYLDTIGVYDALDLRQCDEDDVTEITKLLKKIQRKVFTTCIAKDN